MKVKSMGFDPYSLNLTPRHWMEDEVLCECVFHKDSNPSLTFKLSTGDFYCFSCGVGGSVKKLAEHTGGFLEWKMIKKEHGKKHESMWKKLLGSDLALDNDYLMSRKVTNAQVEKWGIRQQKDNIIFPLTAYNGDIEGIIIRQPESKTRYLYFGYKPPLFPIRDFNIAQQQALEGISRPPILCEGIFGLLRMDLFGIPAACTLGASPKKDLPKHLLACTIAFDDDYAGYVGAGKLLRASNQEQNVVAVYPGMEVDELNYQKAMLVYNREISVTSSFLDLAMFVDDKESYEETCRRFSMRVSFN